MSMQHHISPENSTLFRGDYWGVWSIMGLLVLFSLGVLVIKLALHWRAVRAQERLADAAEKIADRNTIS